MADTVNQGDKSIYIKENNGTISIKYGDEKVPKFLGDPLTFIHNTHFVGRTEDLKNLRQIFFDDKKEIILLSSDAGIGKTGLAAQYYKENESDYSHLIWLVSEPNINQKIQTLAKSVNVTLNDDFTQEQKLDFIYDKLRNLDKPTLLVVDDNDDYQDLKDTCPRLSSLNIHTLITTRISELKPYFVYGLGRLKDKEIIKLFKQHYPLFDTNETHILEQIITIADKNTLLIEIFAKNIESKNTRNEIRFSLNELKNTIENGLHNIFINEEITVNHNRTKKERSKQDKKAMSVLLALYDTEKLEEIEKNLLYTFTLLPKGEIHYETLKALTQEERIDKQLQSLTRKGWIKENIEDNTYSIKTLVKESISYRYKEGIQDIADSLLERISELIDDEGKSKEEIQQIIEIYLPLGKVVLESVMAISSKLNDTVFGLLEDLFFFEKKLLNVSSDYSVSYEQLKSYIKQQEAKNGGNPSTSLLEFYHVFIRVCEKENKLLEAIEYQDLIINICREFNEEDKKGLAQVLSKGSMLCLKYKGNQLQKSLEYREEEGSLLTELNSFPMERANWQSNIGVVLRNLGGKENLEKAKEYLENALTICLNYFEETNPTVAIKQSNLAIVLGNLGGGKNLDKAKKNLKKTLETNIQHFGKNHSIVATSQSNLASLLKVLGGLQNLEQAKEHLEQALITNTLQFGENSFIVARTQSNLAIVLTDLGNKEDLEKAKKMDRIAFFTMKKLFPLNHPYLTVSLDNLIILYFLMERNEEITELPPADLWQEIRPHFWEWFHKED